MATKLFDLHIEVGKMNTGEYYAKTILGNNGVQYTKIAQHMVDAICEMACEMDASAALQLLEANPALSLYPIGGSQTTAAGTSKHVPAPLGGKISTLPRVNWSDLTRVPKGQCEARCKVHDLFGGTKCASFCKHK